MLSPPMIQRLVPGLAPGALPDEEQRRLRKFVILVGVILVACAASLVSALVQRNSPGIVVSAVMLAACGASVSALRRGVNLAYVVTAFLCFGLALSAFFSIHAGPAGYASVYWMGTSPLIALAVGGRRAGYVTLGVALTALLFSTLAIERAWFEPMFPMLHSLAMQATSLVGVVLTLFFIVIVYEVETERIIAALKDRNTALAEARAESERATRAKSEFLATMSHELRTPLNGVTGLIPVLEEERDPEKLREGLRVMRQSADTLLAVINDVLDFSKIESNQLELENVSFSPRGELELIVDLMKARATENHVTLELSVTPDVPEAVAGDPMRLRQVLMNLVSNAVKFSRGGLVTCHLDAQDDWLTLVVRDTGIGMSPSVVARLFTPFTQGEASTTRRFGGTGLGLVITQRLVEAMGGNIRVTSTPGLGSRFTVRLPVRPPGAASPSEPPLPATLSSTPPGDGVSASPSPGLPERATPLPTQAAAVPETARPVPAPGPARRVLLVEDNAVNQLVARRLLEQLGHEVAVVEDGQQALDACEATTFDVILMDCHMPVLDGYEATRALRARGVRTPIYAVTAAVSVDDRARCISAGMDDVIAKPLRLERLREAVAAAPPRAKDRTAA